MLTSTPGSVIDPDCETGKGFLGVEAFAKNHRPRIIILENVRTMFAKRQTESGESPFLVIFKDF